MPGDEPAASPVPGPFQKYFFVLFLVVVVPLAANGASRAWFGYRDQRARLDQLLGIEARSAAARIQGFLDGISNQLGWLLQLPWSEEPDERRRKGRSAPSRVARKSAATGDGALPAAGVAH